MSSAEPIVDILTAMYSLWHFFVAFVVALFVAAMTGSAGSARLAAVWAAVSFVGMLALTYLA